MDDIKNDPRFAHIVSDPKFRLMPKSKRKVKIDSRFRSIFTSQHFSHKTDTDKRGRPLLDKSKQNNNVMQRFYNLSDDEKVDVDSDPEIAISTKKKKKKHPSSFVGDEPETIPKRKKRRTESESCIDKKIKYTDDNTKKQSCNSISQQNDISGDDDSSKSTSEEDDDSDDELPEFTQEFVLEETEIDHKWNELREDTPTVVESTSRLAVCNMDWDFVKAQDLFIVFKSFVPDGGCVKSVTIYPSEFGKERMAEEARLGPREMREKLGSDSVNSSGNEKSRNNKKKVSVDQQQAKRSTKEQEASNTEKLREYQLNRMRYYFAVVVCDSARTSETIYNECDGREYLLSSVMLDLRFIPESMTFDDVPKEVFSEEQKILEYEPNKFSSTALSQAKVDVTWDETDFDRLSRRVAGLQHKELEAIVEENKFADIIAPPESDSDEDIHDRPDWLDDAIDGSEGDKVYTEEEKIAMYRKLFVDALHEGEEEETEAGDKEYVWQPGLKSSAVKKIQKKEKREAESGIVSEYLEKKRDKKKKKKEKKMIAKDDKIDQENDFSDGDEGTRDRHEGKNGNGDPDQSSNLKKKKKKRSAIDERGTQSSMTADLELLVMGDNDNHKGDNENKDGAVSGKMRKKKSKKKKLLEGKDEFRLDVDDARFSALYTSHLFHIDPTASQYKNTKNMNALMNEQVKRRDKYARHALSSAVQSVNDSKSQSTESSKSLSKALVDSLKSKMKK